MRRRIARGSLVALLALAGWTTTVRPADAQAPPQTVANAGSFKVKFGLEYWVRASWRGNFDFDAAQDDGLLFGWQRVKPLITVENNWLELTAQGQDAHSYGLPELNPNGARTAPSATSRLDFIKAYARVGPRQGISFKVGRDQADGVDLGISRKLTSSSNYGTVLKSFDVASIKWEGRRGDLLGFVSSPVESRPTSINVRTAGELFSGIQAQMRSGKNLHRGYLVARTISRDVLSSEAGVKGDGAVYALGFQETGPILTPAVIWEIEGIAQWGHRSTDTIRAGAVFVTGTHNFTPNQVLWAGYHQASGDGTRGDGTTHLYDPMYASGFNNYGYMGFSLGRNIRDLRVGGISVLAGPATLYWAYHEQFLSAKGDSWYGIFTPNITRTNATSTHLGREVDATVMLRFPFAKRATIGLGYLGFFPGGYLTATGPHASAHQFTIDVFGQF